MKKLILPLLLFFLFFVTISFAQFLSVVTSQVIIACFDSTISLGLDKNVYITTDVANMTVYIRNNNTFPMNPKLVIELRDQSASVKTMVSDTIFIDNKSWYNFSYYNDFIGVPTGTYTMRAKLLDSGDNQLTDCNNNPLIYDYPNVAVTTTSISVPGGGGGGIVPSIPLSYSVTCPFNVQINQPLNIGFNITNPTQSLYQTILSTEVSKDDFNKKIKSVVVTEPGSYSTWHEHFGNAVCSMPYGLYSARVTWKKVSGEIIRSDELSCFDIPKCEKIEITNFIINKDIFYINNTANITAIVTNTGNTIVTSATLNLSIEHTLTGHRQFEQFFITNLYPEQRYISLLITNLTKLGPYNVKAILEKDNRIVDKAEKSILVTLEPQFNLVTVLILGLSILIILLIIRRQREERKEKQRRLVKAFKRMK